MTRLIATRDPRPSRSRVILYLEARKNGERTGQAGTELERHVHELVAYEAADRLALETGQRVLAYTTDRWWGVRPRQEPVIACGCKSHGDRGCTWGIRGPSSA